MVNARRAGRKPPRSPAARRRSAGGAFEFNHAMIYVRNLPRALRFYEGGLGFRVLERQAPFYARLRSPRGRTTLALHRRAADQPMNSRTEGVRLYFETPDLDGACRRLRARGVRFSDLPRDMPWGWRHAYLRDPDGHELSLYWAGRRRFARASP